MTVTRACASGLQAVTLAAAAIERGEADVMIAGGCDSTSNAEVEAAAAGRPRARAARARQGHAGGLPRARSRKLVPLTEIAAAAAADRRAHDRRGDGRVGRAHGARATRSRARRRTSSPLRSHQRAAARDRERPLRRRGHARSSVGDGTLGPRRRPRARRHQPREARASSARCSRRTARSPPATRARSPTAPRAVLLMSEEKARALGYKPLAAFRSWAYVGVDPADQLLIGPALAMPKALDARRASSSRTSISSTCTRRSPRRSCACSRCSARRRSRGRGSAATTRSARSIRRKLNVHGGSIALGHPFGATGARMVTTMANELALTGKQTALLGICAAGGLGAAAVLERVAEEGESDGTSTKSPFERVAGRRCAGSRSSAAASWSTSSACAKRPSARSTASARRPAS